MEPDSHQRKRRAPSPVQVNYQGASSAIAWMHAKYPTFTQSKRLPFQLRVKDPPPRRLAGRDAESAYQHTPAGQCQTFVIVTGGYGGAPPPTWGGWGVDERPAATPGRPARGGRPGPGKARAVTG